MSRCEAGGLPICGSAADATDRTWMERYSRQIILPGVGGTGQRLLSRATVGIYGCGQIGTPLALYLAGAGVGRLVLIESERADALCAMVLELNPLLQVTVMDPPDALDGAVEAMMDWQLAVIAGGGVALRNRLNRASLCTGRPLLAAWESSVAVQIAAAQAGVESAAPCLRCAEQAALPYLARLRAVDPLLLRLACGVAGSLLAMEVVQRLLQRPSRLWSHTYLFHPEQSLYQTVAVAKISSCPVCMNDGGCFS
ncbi:MAG: ThiF family adenylyltransferase [Magnetococcales bacterium]|nr:ThiF family adenylyltransferase [Magnetococcales bacterium]MBF0113552.1 ThiF family adenylyltransferase [Magnetococcales bacterium]